MLRLFGCAMMLGLLTLTWAARPVTHAKKAPVKKSAVKSSKSSKKAPVRRAATWRTRQMAPTPARYRQIQEALAAKGYLRREDATGAWNQASIDGLKKFQTEQKIESSGRINSI